MVSFSFQKMFGTVQTGDCPKNCVNKRKLLDITTMLVSVCCLETVWSEWLKMDGSSIVGVYVQKRKGTNCCLSPLQCAEEISFVLTSTRL